MAEGVLEHLGESVQQLGPLGLTVGHQEGDESLAVRPPQLHAPLQLVQNGKVRRSECVRATGEGNVC